MTKEPAKWTLWLFFVQLSTYFIIKNQKLFINFAKFNAIEQNS